MNNLPPCCQPDSDCAETIRKTGIPPCKKGKQMTKIEQARGAIAQKYALSRGMTNIMGGIPKECYRFADSILKALDSLGLVLEADDQTLPKNPYPVNILYSDEIKRRAYHEAQVDMANFRRVVRSDATGGEVK